MNKSTIDQLLKDLKNADENIRQRATAELWRIWFEQKGALGLELLRRAQIFWDIGEIAKAEEILTETIDSQPDFAEAWNRRAVLYYTQGQYEKSRSDCEQVVKLNSVHFGAWHGLGLCHAALGNYLEGIQAFRKALEIQPYALVNQKLILECTARLN
ncbi:MAG: tetratricopeptide repeat protein [Xenococcaceae cyanobacterium]